MSNRRLEAGRCLRLGRSSEIGRRPRSRSGEPDLAAPHDLTSVTRTEAFARSVITGRDQSVFLPGACGFPLPLRKPAIRRLLPVGRKTLRRESWFLRRRLLCRLRKSASRELPRLRRARHLLVFSGSPARFAACEMIAPSDTISRGSLSNAHSTRRFEQERRRVPTGSALIGAHRFQPLARRTPPGNRGSSTDRPHRDEHPAVTGKSSNTSRTCIPLPACRIACKRQSLGRSFR